MDQPRPQPDQETLDRFLQEPFSGGTLGGPESLSLDLDSPRLPPGVEMPQAMASGVWGRFQICGFLGQGGMGQVFEAFDPTLQRKIALKVLRSDLASDADRVLQEARNQAKIEHPHVVKVFETGEIEGRAYLAMQLIPGRTLMEVGRTLPLEAGLRLLVQACYGVHAAHTQDLLHRDLKPNNILVGVSEEGRHHAYVTDFGLALDVRHGEAFLHRGTPGTPLYMSPEQVRLLHMDPRSDVYSLGVCLYWLLTGKYPYRGETTPEILQAVLGAAPIPPREFESRLREDLQAICLRCLAKEREDRYPSARALAEDLERWLNGFPVLAMPATLCYRATLWVARNPLLAFFAALIVALSLASAGLLTWNWNRARTQTRYALHFNQAVGDLEMDLASIYQSPDRVEVSLSTLKGRLSGLERELEGSGRLAAGPGHGALGRAWIALEDLNRAEAHFREALRLGFATPETRLGLGIVLAAQFQESQRLMLGYDPVVQDSLRKEARRALADASLEQLRLARFHEPPVLIQGRLLMGTGQYRAAAKLLEEAVARQPWRQDLRRLQGEILLAAYVSSLDATVAAPGEPTFEDAQRVLAESRNWVRSDPFYWVKEGELRLARSQRRKADPTEVEASAEEIHGFVRRALELYPDYLPALALSAQVHSVLARRMLATERDSGRELDEAERRCRRILDLRQGYPQAHAMLLRVAAMRLARWPFPPEAADPAPLVKEGMGHFEAALKSLPSLAGILSFEAADLHQAYALWLLRNNQGDAAREPIARGQALIQDALAHLPQWAPAYSTRASLKQWEALCSEDSTAHLLDSVKDLETCLRLEPRRAAYFYNCASRYCDLAIQRLEVLDESPLEFTERAIPLALEAQRLDPADDTNMALVAKAKTLQLVHELRTGGAGFLEVQGLVASMNRLRPVLRSSFIPKLWLECAQAQHLRGEKPEWALAEGRRTLAQALTSPMGRVPLEVQSRVLQIRREASLGCVSGAEIKAVRAKIDDLPNVEFALHEIRLSLLLARHDPEHREARWTRARELVERLKRELSLRSSQTRLLAAGLEAEVARGRGKETPAWALEELQRLAQPGSSQRLEAELFLKGQWR